jgi:hypothetical protein
LRAAHAKSLLAAPNFLNSFTRLILTLRVPQNNPNKTIQLIMLRFVAKLDYLAAKVKIFLFRGIALDSIQLISSTKS